MIISSGYKPQRVEKKPECIEVKSGWVTHLFKPAKRIEDVSVVLSEDETVYPNVATIKKSVRFGKGIQPALALVSVL